MDVLNRAVRSDLGHHVASRLLVEAADAVVAAPGSMELLHQPGRQGVDRRSRSFQLGRGAVGLRVSGLRIEGDAESYLREAPGWMPTLHGRAHAVSLTDILAPAS